MPNRIGIGIVSCVLALGPSRAMGAADWPQFQGPTGQGISTATGLPVTWNTKNNIAWKIEVPGRGWSSPVYSNGKVYFTTAVGGANEPVSLRAICIDSATGHIAWNVEVFRPQEAATREMNQKNSLASPTPIVTADRLFVHFGHLGTAALDLSGKVIWRQTTLKYPPVHGNGGSPALVGDTLVFSCDGASNPFVAGLDATTGAVKWKTPRNNVVGKHFSFSTPLAIDVNGATQVISPGSGFVGAYDPRNGAELWRVRYGEGYSVVPRPVYADGLLFVSSGFDSPVVYGINPAGASGDVTGTHVAWTHRKGAPNTPSMLAVGDELYFVSDMGIATCADARTGKVYWSHRLNGTFSASPVFGEGRIYLQTESGMGIVLKAGKTFQTLSENDLGERSLASDAVIDGALFIRTEHHLWKIAGEVSPRPAQR